MFQGFITRGVLAAFLLAACSIFPNGAFAGPKFIAYQVPAGTAGNQEAGVGLGMDFDVLLDVSVTRIGVFDSGSDGLFLPIKAYLFDRDAQTEITSLEFTPEDPGDLVGGSRFKTLATPIDLSAGFHGTIMAEGYGPGEPNGNQGEGAIALSTEAGNCSLFFVGFARVSTVPGGFPPFVDGGPPNRYAAGTFEFEALESPGHSGGIAYNSPFGTFGNQNAGSSLGMDFDAKADMIITSLGVFDDGSDGINLSLTARLYNRLSRIEMASLSFTTDDPGDLIEGSRFKSLSSPISLPAGFQGTIVGEGYGDLEHNGNQVFGPLDLLVDDGGCTITFTGTSRYGSPGIFPEVEDTGPANRYAAGTFEFDPSDVHVPRPNPPSGLSAEARNGQVILRWNAPAGGGPAIAGYNVFSTKPGGLTRINPGLVAGTQFTANDVLNGVEYCFVVTSSTSGFIDSVFSNGACATPVGGLPTQTFIAFQVPDGTLGKQDAGAPLGLDFQANVKTAITRLGVFDSGADGLNRTITARLYDADTQAELVNLVFTPGDPGTLTGSYRFKPLAVPIEVPEGFIGTIVGEGYGLEEMNGNENLGPVGVAFDDGQCSLTFLGARYGAPGTFPANFDSGTRYAAGTFEFGPPAGVVFPPSVGGIAYEVPEGTVSTQAFGGALGLDFNVLSPILVKRLGVFDDGSDGLRLPITARLYNRATQTEVVSLDFPPGDPGELVGGNRLKPTPDIIILPAGFEGTIVAEGYGPTEGNGNGHGAVVSPWRVNDGGCLLEFVGSGRPGDAGVFPTALDGGPPNRYAAGTFEFEPTTLQQPNPPVNLTAQLAGTTDVDLAWEAPVGGNPFVGYNVWQTRPTPAKKINGATVGGTTFKVIGLLNGIDACFIVRAVGADGAESKKSNEACVTLPSGSPCEGCVIAYQSPRGTAGGQAVDVALGMDFDVELGIRITRLGAFDDNSDGFRRTITVRLYDRDAQTELASIDFTPDDSGELIGGNRFKPLDEPIDLDGGFHGAIVGEGFGPEERNGNQGVPPAGAFSTDAGKCSSIAFVGASRNGPAGTFPVGLDNGPPNRYGSGTFEFQPTEAAEEPVATIAYIVPASTVGNQAVTGALGMDFDVNADISVTALGVFDDGSDGLNATITARLYDRSNRTELANLVFTPQDSGELIGGSRFKDLSPAISLAAGFQGTIVAEGYNLAEKNGNQGEGPLDLKTDSGGCLITFVGAGRNSAFPRQFPTRIDRGPANRYAAGTFKLEPAGGPPVTIFHRGDADQNGSLQLTDAVQVLSYLFLGTPTHVPECLDAADADDNGKVQLTDGVRILGFLFLGTAPPLPPFGPPGPGPACGTDPTADDLDCKTFTQCAQ